MLDFQLKILKSLILRFSKKSLRFSRGILDFRGGPVDFWWSISIPNETSRVLMKILVFQGSSFDFQGKSSVFEENTRFSVKILASRRTFSKNPRKRGLRFSRITLDFRGACADFQWQVLVPNENFCFSREFLRFSRKSSIFEFNENLGNRWTAPRKVVSLSKHRVGFWQICLPDSDASSQPFINFQWKSSILNENPWFSRKILDFQGKPCGLEGKNSSVF